MSQSSTSYLTITMDKDYVVNELIDGYDAAAVPDNIVADRLESAGYSLGLQYEKDAIAELEENATGFGATTALTAANVYGICVDIATKLTTAKVPQDKRWLIVSATLMAYY
jgi:hypothetical protein